MSEKKLDSVEAVGQLLEDHPWTFAKTMPKSPHWYSLRKNWFSDEEFAEVVRFIRAHGTKEKFAGRSYVYLTAGGFRYWTMGSPVDRTILINRVPVPTPEPTREIDDNKD